MLVTGGELKVLLHCFEIAGSGASVCCDILETFLKIVIVVRISNGEGDVQHGLDHEAARDNHDSQLEPPQIAPDFSVVLAFVTTN